MSILNWLSSKALLIGDLEQAQKVAKLSEERALRWQKHYNSVWEEKEKVIASLITRNDQIIKLIEQTKQIKKELK